MHFGILAPMLQMLPTSLNMNSAQALSRFWIAALASLIEKFAFLRSAFSRAFTNNTVMHRKLYVLDYTHEN
jgi:hypothetical protein